MCFEKITSFLGGIVAPVWTFLNSPFFLTIMGTFAAAFAGAYGAQVIIEKTKNKEGLLKEIRNTNAAIMVAFGICNTYLSLKKQHVKALKEDFDKQQAALNEFHAGRRAGKIPQDAVFQYQADFQTITPLWVPTDILQALAFEKISLNGRPLSLITTLTNTIHSLNESIEARNKLIEGHKATTPNPPEASVRFYFGLPDQDGHIDFSYPATIDAIASQTDDAIFFSHLLCKDLQEHGIQLRRKFKVKARAKLPNINAPDFTAAEKAGLMPDSNNYSDWTTMFVVNKNTKKAS